MKEWRKEGMNEWMKLFAPENVFQLHSRVPDLSHFPTWWWCGSHDDVADMVIEMDDVAAMMVRKHMLPTSFSKSVPGPLVF